MAFLHLNVRCGFAWLGNKYPNLKTLFQCTINQRNKKYFNTVSLKSQSKCLVSQKVTHAINRFAGSTPQNQLSLDFDPACMSQCTITNEIQFFRDNRNDFHGLSFSNTKEPYGPPLAILLPWETLHMRNLKKFIQTYGEKGFDIVTVNLSAEQLMYPCVAGGAMNVVSDLLQYLNESHKHRPYIFHGFSVAAYIYGEIMAQFSDQYETYRSLMNNVKGCLWDSPVDILLAKPYIGKFFYPNNIFCRFDLCN